jgi:uncharacterized protein YkwD
MIELNWIDFIILIVLLYYAFEGYSIGFIASLLDFISFISSFIIGLKYYGVIGAILIETFSIPQSFSSAIGFFIVSFLSQMIVGLTLRKILGKKILASQFYSKLPIVKVANKFLGIVPGIFSGLVLLAFLLTLLITFPSSVFLKNLVLTSFMGRELVGRTQGFEKELNNIFGGAVNETLNFLTVEPKSNESVGLKFNTSNFSVDKNAEQEMFTMVNQERTKQGIGGVVFNEQLAQVGRDHCGDMFRRGYFSHYTPEGHSPFDRMDRVNISYIHAGENLALAPDVNLAMRGLMQSPGHRENILSPNFGKLGIGVIDGGIYGEMFCQEFTD